MRNILLPAVLVVLISGVSGCGICTDEKVVPLPAPVHMTSEFAYVQAVSERDGQSGNMSTDLAPLRNWLVDHPGRRIVSMTGVLAYRGGVSCFLVYHEAGDNSHQRFDSFRSSSAEKWDIGGGVSQPLLGLSQWKKNSSQACHIVAITNVPAYSGGVEEYIVCFERFDK